MPGHQPHGACRRPGVAARLWPGHRLAVLFRRHASEADRTSRRSRGPGGRCAPAKRSRASPERPCMALRVAIVAQVKLRVLVAAGLLEQLLAAPERLYRGCCGPLLERVVEKGQTVLPRGWHLLGACSCLPGRLVHGRVPEAHAVDVGESSMPWPGRGRHPAGSAGRWPARPPGGPPGQSHGRDR